MTTTHLNNPIFLTFETHQIRIVLDDQDTPWFNANNVCAALGHTNPAKVLANHVRAEDRTKRMVIEPPGVAQQIDHINPCGVYFLIACSPKRKAKRFMHWFIQNIGRVAAIHEVGSSTKQRQNRFTAQHEDDAYHIQGAFSALADLLVPVGATLTKAHLSHVGQAEMSSLMRILSERLATLFHETGLCESS